jgi:hypothetical protein
MNTLLGHKPSKPVPIPPKQSRHAPDLASNPANSFRIHTFRFAATPAWASSLTPPVPGAAARRGPHGRGRSASDCEARREGRWWAGMREEEAVPARASIGRRSWRRQKSGERRRVRRGGCRTGTGKGVCLALRFLEGRFGRRV